MWPARPSPPRAPVAPKRPDHLPEQQPGRPGSVPPFTRRTPRVVAASRLHRRRERDQARRFLAEGPQAVREALAGGDVIELFGTGEALDRYADLAAGAPKVSVVAPDGLAALAETVAPQGLVAVCRYRDLPLDAVLREPPSLVAALVEIRDPGNAGTVLRTADAAGAGAAVAGAGAGAAAAGAAAGAGAAAAAPSSMIAMTCSLFTVSPTSWRISFSTPSTGAGTSSTTLSVSRSTRFSSRFTASPAFLCQAAMVASETDSGRTGTLSSMDMRKGLLSECAHPWAQNQKRPSVAALSRKSILRNGRCRPVRSAPVRPTPPVRPHGC